MKKYYFYKSCTPSWVFFTFLEFNKWCQIAQSVSVNEWVLLLYPLKMRRLGEYMIQYRVTRRRTTQITMKYKLILNDL